MDFLSDADPAKTCREISAPQLDRARNVQFHHFPIDRERRITVLVGQHCHTVADGKDETFFCVDFHAFQALRANQVDLVVEVSSIPNERIVLQLLHAALLAPVSSTPLLKKPSWQEAHSIIS